MKLLSYHIENYGKIHNADGQFNSGLTEFCEKNGYGKTTLASFIRAMFYGLPTYTTKTKAFDDRQHFYPFEGGGKFGGNLTFEMQGKVYKIERFFDKKSSKGDECRVYQDGVPFMGFGEEIGKEVFGLDEESFKKTVFITADEIEIESTHAINEKLNRDVVGGEDGDFEAAIEALEKAKKSLKAGRGNNDLISGKKLEILDLTARIQNMQDTSDGLTVEYVEREGLTKEIAGLEADLKRAGEHNLILQKWETLDNLTAQTEQKQTALQGYREKYPKGMPTEEERKTLRVCIEEKSRLSGALQTAAFGEDKEKALAALTQKFAGGVPTNEEITEKQQALVRLATLTTEAKAWQNRQQSEREKELAQRFAIGLPTDEALREKRAEAEEYKRREAQLKELHNALVNSAPTQPKGAGKLICFALAAVCVLVGGILTGLAQFIIGVPLLLVGLVLGGVGFVLHGKGKASGLPTNDVTVKIAETQAQLRVLEEKIRAFTVLYRYYSEAGAIYDFNALEEGVRAYRMQVQAMQEGEQRFACVIQEIEQIQEKTQAYLSQYGEVGDLHEGLNRLILSVSSYQSLLADKDSASGKTEDARVKISQCQNKINEVLQKYDLDENMGTMYGLNALEVDFKRMQELRVDIADLEENLTNYKQKNGLSERPQGQSGDVDELHARLSMLRKQLADCDKRIAEAERIVEGLPDTESELEQAEEKLEEYKQRHQLFSDTIDALKGAEKSLKDRYVAPIKERFSYYAEALERVLDEKISMDSDYRVKFERGGEERSERHLSAGERSLCALCLRLALIDNMYEAEQPFIVMDDPFVHLDEVHLKRVADLMQALTKGRQIIYFCCHESRSML